MLPPWATFLPFNRATLFNRVTKELGCVLLDENEREESPGRRYETAAVTRRKIDVGKVGGSCEERARNPAPNCNRG